MLYAFCNANVVTEFMLAELVQYVRWVYKSKYEIQLLDKKNKY